MNLKSKITDVTKKTFYKVKVFNNNNGNFFLVVQDGSR